MIELIAQSMPRLLQGTWVTIWLTVLAVSIGLTMAVPLSLALVAKSRAVRWPVLAFTFYFRGTPLLVQIFLIYFGSGQFRGLLDDMGLWTFFRDASFCAVLALSLNHAGYSAEILRGGIRSVPHGEIEAARACGMSGAKLYRRIILPVAFRMAWPAYTNEVVFMLQATSLVSIITIMDLTGQARSIASRTYAIYEMYITAAVLYLVLVYLLLYCFRKMERNISAHLRDRVVHVKPA